jgi:acyl-CoA synthetase (AMP-forming)/AMP-acid ligase II
MHLYQIIQQAAQIDPEKTAVICGGEKLSYGQLTEMIGFWAGKLRALGIRRGDRVAVLMHNSLELVVLYWACFRLGAIAVPINTRYQKPELAYALNQSGSKILIANGKFSAIVQKIHESAPELAGVYLMGPALREIFSKGSPLTEVPAIETWPEGEISDPAIIIYTSGSTGKPKGVIHTHYTLYHHILNKTKAMGIDREEVGLAGTQISHVAGFAGVLLPVLANGGTCVMVQEFEPGIYIEHLKKFRPTLLVPC